MTSPATEICLIDDEVDILSSVSEPLRNEYSVRTFTSASVALQEFDNGLKPAVIVTDLRMPGLDGLGLIQKLRERKSTSNIVLVSGHADKSDGVKALNFGVTGFLEKPFTIRQLKQLISQTIPDPLSLKKEAEDLEQLYKMTENLERLGENYFSRALADESAIVENAQSLYSAVGQRLRLLEMVREQRTLKYKISEIRKLIEAKTIKIEAA